MKQSILIPDGEKLYAFFAMYCLKKACRHFRFVVCSDKFFSNPPYSKYISKCYRLAQKEDDGQYKSELLNIIRTEHIDLLLPCTTEGIEFILHNKDELEKECTIIALPTLESFNLVSDKWTLYKTLETAGIPTPASTLLQNMEQLKTARYPLLLKPTHGESGVNIRRLDGYPDEAVIGWLDNTKGDFIIQEYIDGTDIDCSILASKGEILAHTNQRNLGEKANFIPGNDKVKFIKDDLLLETVRRTSELISWTGVAHIDLIRDNQGIYRIIDFNPRFWGSILGSYSAGVNFPFLVYQLTMNNHFEYPDFNEIFFVSFRRFLKEAGKRKVPYGLKETNLKFILDDPLFTLRKFLRLH